MALDHLRTLVAEYEAWCTDNELPHKPPDELMEELHAARDLTDAARKIDRITAQLQWLAAFIERLENAKRGPGA
jgi:hypothetical protein